MSACTDKLMSDFQRTQSWKEKFASALRGIILGIRGHRSFAVHLPLAVIVMFAGAVLQVSWLELILLVLCIASVLVAELFNSSLETIARAVSRKYDDNLKDALDISSGAVLLASGCAALVGILILGRQLMEVWLK
jgi:diacylglycerol kinase